MLQVQAKRSERLGNCYSVRVIDNGAIVCSLAFMLRGNELSTGVAATLRRAGLSHEQVAGFASVLCERCGVGEYKPIPAVPMQLHVEAR